MKMLTNAHKILFNTKLNSLISLTNVLKSLVSSFSGPYYK